MDCGEIIIEFNDIGIDDRIHEFKMDIYLTLRGYFGSNPIMEELNYPKIINGLRTTRISAINLTNLPIDVDAIQEALTCVIDNYKEYYNLKVYLSV